jgi:hypothetical protein
MKGWFAFIAICLAATQCPSAAATPTAVTVTPMRQLQIEGESASTEDSFNAKAVIIAYGVVVIVWAIFIYLVKKCYCNGCCLKVEAEQEYGCLGIIMHRLLYVISVAVVELSFLIICILTFTLEEKDDTIWNSLFTLASAIAMCWFNFTEDLYTYGLGKTAERVRERAEKGEKNAVKFFDKFLPAFNQFIGVLASIEGIADCALQIKSIKDPASAKKALRIVGLVTGCIAAAIWMYASCRYCCGSCTAKDPKLSKKDSKKDPATPLPELTGVLATLPGP